jgi:hypothetical protein
MIPLAGAVVWLAATIAFKLNAIESLFLWAPLVVVPLGLDLILPSGPLRIAQPAAALLAAASYAFEPGGLAAALAAPWAVFCAALAVVGAIRFIKRREFFVDAALGLIAVGGWGFLMSRAGMKPAGFEEPIVLLTAVHFHYAGFVAPLLAALAARRAGPRRPILIAGAAIVIGTPVLALGWTLHVPALKMIAVSAISGGLFILSMEMTWIATDTPRELPRALTGVAAFSIFLGMVFAVLYGIGELVNFSYIGIPAMALSHGILNGFGFATCGLLGARGWRTP